jgi:D-3-phosphoglycerate dehydrogenase
MADGLIVNLARIDAASFERLSRCRVIARLGVGFNNIDVENARRRNIIVTNVPDYCREEVSDHALALMLTLARSISVANFDVQRGEWDQLRYRSIKRISAITLGLIGLGRLATALARKARALEMSVIAYDPFVTPDAASSIDMVTIDELLKRADVISLHAPLNENTRGLLGAKAFEKVKRGTILVNTSRGELVDEQALAAALDSGNLSGAALDVFSSEPLDARSPLRGRPNVLLTPHMAFFSEQSIRELQQTAADDVVRVLSGETPRHRIA